MVILIRSTILKHLFCKIYISCVFIICISDHPRHLSNLLDVYIDTLMINITCWMEDAGLLNGGCRSRNRMLICFACFDATDKIMQKCNEENDNFSAVKNQRFSWRKLSGYISNMIALCSAANNSWKRIDR